MVIPISELRASQGSPTTKGGDHNWWDVHASAFNYGE